MTRNLIRLGKRADFLLAAKASKAARRNLVLQARDRADEDAACRIGFTVTRKVGNAVVRNRVRRRLRAAMREAAPLAHDGHDYVLIGRRGALSAPFAEIAGDLAAAFAKIHSRKIDSRKETD